MLVSPAAVVNNKKLPGDQGSFTIELNRSASCIGIKRYNLKR